MYKRVCLALCLGFACVGSAVPAQPVYIRTNMHDMFLSWWPHEYCKELSEKKAECWDAAPRGSTVGWRVVTDGDCYIDFDHKGGTWHLRGTRGGCSARVKGDSFIVY